MIMTLSAAYSVIYKLLRNLSVLETAGLGLLSSNPCYHMTLLILQ
jgi:hypothetical protein